MRANWPTPNLWGVGVSFHKSNGFMDWSPVESIVAPKTHRSGFWFPIEFTMFSIFFILFWGVAIPGKPGKLSNSTDAKRQDVVQVVPIKGVSTASSQHWSQMAQTLVVSNWVSLGKSAGNPWFFYEIRGGSERPSSGPIPRTIQRFLEKHPGPAWHPSTCPGAIPMGNMLIEHWIWGYNRDWCLPAKLIKISRQRQCWQCPILQFAFKLCGQPNVDALWPQHPGCDIQDLYLPQLFGKEAS